METTIIGYILGYMGYVGIMENVMEFFFNVLGLSCPL